MMDATIIIGGAGGIGSAVAAAAKEFGPVIIAGRNLDSLEATTSLLGSDVTSYQVDATKGADVLLLVDSVTKQKGKKIAIVNCAGSLLLKPAHMTTEEEFSSVLALNLVTAFNCLRALGKYGGMGSSAVLMSSCAAGIGLANHEAISAAKAGIEGLCRSFAATYASKGVRCNCVAPGLVQTNLTSRITHNPQSIAFSEALHPLGKLGVPQDIASLASYLADSEKSSWITGQVFRVDGGLVGVKNRSEQTA